MTPILHHYPPSLFSEKIRALFGYLGLEWRSVIIPPIMPRPFLMPLSGGYRKTPIMQIGANVYCDTEIIARTLAERAENKMLYAPGFAAEQVARWADTELFRTVVALNFRPEAIAAQMSQLSQAEIEAFQADRAELSGGAPMVGADPAAAEAHFQGVLESLERSLNEDFLFGSEPSIADFSVYHCLWFVAGNEANAPLLTSWPSVGAFIERMRGFGHGSSTDLSGEAALAEGTDAEPVAPASASVDPRLTALAAGQPVTVSADDYGRHPIAGHLVHFSATEVVIERTGDQAGRIMVHVPNVGFEVRAA